MVRNEAITSPRQGLPVSSCVGMPCLAKELTCPAEAYTSVLCRFLVFGQIPHIKRFLGGCLEIAHGLKQHTRPWLAMVIHGASQGLVCCLSPCAISRHPPRKRFMWGMPRNRAWTQAA